VGSLARDGLVALFEVVGILKGGASKGKKRQEGFSSHREKRLEVCKMEENKWPEC